MLWKKLVQGGNEAIQQQKWNYREDNAYYTHTHTHKHKIYNNKSYTWTHAKVRGDACVATKKKGKVFRYLQASARKITEQDSELEARGSALRTFKGPHTKDNCVCWMPMDAEILARFWHLTILCLMSIASSAAAAATATAAVAVDVQLLFRVLVLGALSGLHRTLKHNYFRSAAAAAATEMGNAYTYVYIYAYLLLANLEAAFAVGFWVAGGRPTQFNPC